MNRGSGRAEREVACSEERVGNLLPYYEMGSLEAADVARFEDHLLRCPACFDDLYRGAPIASVLNESGRRLAGDLAVARHPWWSLRQPQWGWSLAAAAVVLVAILLPGHLDRGPDDELRRLAAIEPEPYDAFVLRDGEAAEPAEAAFQEGMAYYDLGRYRDALTALREAHARMPGRDDVAYFLGLDLLLAGETDDGIAILEPLALRSGTFATRAALNAGLGHLRAGRPNAARVLWERAAAGEGPAATRAKDLRRAKEDSAR